MKAAISSSGTTLESRFDARFGRAAAFCLVDSESGEWTAHANPALGASGGAGVQAAQFVAGLGAEAVVSGAYGPNAFNTLSPAGITMYVAPSGEDLTVAGVLELLRAGTLQVARGASHGGHHQGHR